MPSVDLLRQVEESLQRIPEGDFSQTASQLLSLLGYESDRIPPEQTGDAADFIKQFPAENPNTASEKEFLAHDPTVQILFQVTGSEIDFPAQRAMLDRLFDISISRSFVFATVDLRGETYPRGMYAKLAREVNKRLTQPTVVLFRTATGMLTIAFMERRPDKRKERDVLGRVSLIREINPNAPHQAHVRILADLSLQSRLDWMRVHQKPANFDGLLAAWLDCLDTEALNKQFYKHLFRWFENAVKTARFPTEENPSQEEQIIRLITRLLFIWFIKEKGLVHPDLFVEDQVRPLLRDYDRAEGDSYYLAILQNLFFATLNTEISNRAFDRNGQHPQDGGTWQYRYQDEIIDSDRLLSLFATTPFINGGLFDCLDKPNPDVQQDLIDCFTDHPNHRELLSVPNRLFFGPDGLITLFSRYRFTVEENTPIEQDVALDPELLGKVFENLLAAFNPETRDTARKQTGSYYTPRQVVDYMVTEALVAHWVTSVQDDFDDKGFWDERLRYLLDYSDDIDDASEIFNDIEIERLIENIAHIKVIDPAVGSGAFPMAILHRVTLALSRLDPKNKAWRATQQRLAASRSGAAFDIRDKNEREKMLLEINETFERYQSDFGRKLYLIQNSIYGVDIQPIACQIAKLRMFISLAIEQQPNNDPEDNYGIRPLPNLESKFVAADTLIGLKGQERLASPRAVDLRAKWAANTERHFHATTPEEKASLVREDKRLRTALASELRHLGMSPDHTDNIANWDRYNQNTSADWFNPKYMFNTTEGFDIVIGNPPYIQLQRDQGALRKKYKPAGYSTLVRRGDIYQLFYERGCTLLRPHHGVLAYITSNSWMRADYGQKHRRLLVDHTTPLSLIEMGEHVFDATVDTNILLLRDGKPPTGVERFPGVDVDAATIHEFPPNKSEWGSIGIRQGDPWAVLSPTEQLVMRKIQSHGTPLNQWNIRINYGIKTGFNTAFIIDQDTRDSLVAQDPRSSDIIKPVLRGRDLGRYRPRGQRVWLVVAKFGSYKTLPQEYPAVHRHLLQHQTRLKGRGQCRYTSSGRRSSPDYQGQHHWLELDNNPTDKFLRQFEEPKLLWKELSDKGCFAYDNSGLYAEATTFVMLGGGLKYLCAVLNSRLMQWLIHKIAPTSGTGTPRWKKAYVGLIPIPRLDDVQQVPFVETVDAILALKDPDASADSAALEAEIDRMVYQLYGLTDEEIAAVEAR